MKTYFTSDFHFNHYNIIRYTHRPFKTLEEMNSIIIHNFNQRVKKEDIVFYLGDFCFRSGSKRGEGELEKPEFFLNQLNCKNIVFVSGNHDKNNSLKTSIQSLVIRHGGRILFLVHNPEYCNPNYELNIVGHVHDKWKFRRYRRGETFTDCCNVGIEQWNYYPVTINEINQEYYKWKKRQI